MNDTNYINVSCPPRFLWLGREQENNYRSVTIDCANWFEAYPNATIVAYYQPYAASDPYPLVLTTEGTKRIWHPTATELVKGDGELQIVLMLGDVVGTSAIIPTRVDRSLISSADHPADEAPSWTVQVVQDVTEQADRAEEAASHYPKIVNGVWYVWSVPDEDFVSTGIEAQGEDGYSPTVTVAEIEGGHRVTITDVDGAHTFDVLDGEDGADGVSPTVQTESITGGHRVTITDKAHPHGQSFDVMDGNVHASYDDITSTLTLHPDTEDSALPQKISAAELAHVTNGVYTLGVVDVTAPIQFPRIQNRGIIIVDTVFNIKTPVLFPPYRNDSYFTLPCFIGCTFNNSLGSRVLISSGGTNIVGGRVTGCNFFNVDYAASTYLQDFNFVNCYIQSYQTFLDNPTSTVQARFVNCDVETESKALVNAKNAYIYASGTYEGNAARNEYHFNAESGVLNFTNCWLENEKLLSLVGGTSITEKTIINMVGCNVQINATPMVVVTNPQYVNLFIDGSVLVPYNSSAIFIDKTAAQMMSVTGDFVRASADAGYVKPIGGVVAEDRKVATIADVPISGFHVPPGSVTPTLSFKTTRHFGGLFIGYNMCAYVYGTSNGSTSGVGGHWGGGDQPTITYDSETGKYTITGKKYQAFTFIPSVDARLYFTDIEIVTD